MCNRRYYYIVDKGVSLVTLNVRIGTDLAYGKARIGSP